MKANKMTRLANFPAILIGLIVGSTFCSSLFAEVTEERRAVTRKQCALEGDVAAVSMKMRLNGTSLEKGLEIIWSISDDEHPTDTMELIMLDAYSFPISNSENPTSTTEQFKIFTLKQCYTRAEIEGRY
jgi:hypothetical protein